MSQFTKEAQDVIDRLAAINYDEPYWNEAEVIKCFERQYKLFGLEMPKIEIADNMLVGYQLARDAAWDAARRAAWGAAQRAAQRASQDAARDAAWDAAQDASRGAAWGAARDASRNASQDASRGAAWDAAWGAAQGAAQDAASLNTGLSDAATLKWIDVSQEELKALENGLGFFFPMQDKLILVPMPRIIMENNATLHYDHGKAVEWKDGTGFYFLHGVKFDDEKLYQSIVDQTITAEDALNIRDTDQRMAAIAMLRPDRLLDQMKAKLVHTGVKGTKLYEVDDFMGTGRTEYCMFMVDSSTPREFIEWVEPTIGKQKDADLCQANAFGIPLEDYLLMELEG